MYFISVDQITGEVQSSTILARLQSWNILITICRGQGIQVFVEFKDAFSNNAPLAFYTHCQAHQLNLCVVKACGISVNILITLQKGSTFLCP